MTKIKNYKPSEKAKYRKKVYSDEQLAEYYLQKYIESRKGKSEF